MAHTYIKNVLKFRFPELRNQEAQREAEAAAREVIAKGFMVYRVFETLFRFIPTPQHSECLAGVQLMTGAHVLVLAIAFYLQARSREINAEKYAQIKETYISTLADIESTLDEMVRAS